MNFDIENQHGACVYGIDEAGCGPLAGPVVAACVHWHRDKYPPTLGVKDSKCLSLGQRERIYAVLEDLKDIALYWSVSIVDVGVIDQINIRNATRLAMQQAYDNLCTHNKDSVVLIDGLLSIHASGSVVPIVKGDQQSISIATAAIIAKVTRDRLMTKLDSDYPEFSWRRNRGYGTQKHLEALRRYGVTPHHRKNYAPVAHEIMKNHWCHETNYLR